MIHKVIFEDVINVEPDINGDNRGKFSEIYNEREFCKIGITEQFLQDNLSFSLKAMTIRGMHFQEEPFSQSKLVKVLRGSIFDVFIDLRRGSKNYEKYGSFKLSPSDGWIYIPKGFAHGFCTLEDSTEVMYKVDNYYNKESENGIRWNDPFYMIDWPGTGSDYTLSEKDVELPLWKEINSDIKF